VSENAGVVTRQLHVPVADGLGRVTGGINLDLKRGP
jgi:hypothetical protein